MAISRRPQPCLSGSDGCAPIFTPFCLARSTVVFMMLKSLRKSSQVAAKQILLYSRCMKTTRNVGQVNGLHEGFIISLSLVSNRRWPKRVECYSRWCRGQSPGNRTVRSSRPAGNQQRRLCSTIPSQREIRPLQNVVFSGSERQSQDQDADRAPMPPFCKLPCVGSCLSAKSPCSKYFSHPAFPLSRNFRQGLSPQQSPDTETTHLAHVAVHRCAHFVRLARHDRGGEDNGRLRSSNTRIYGSQAPAISAISLFVPVRILGFLNVLAHYHDRFR